MHPTVKAEFDRVTRANAVGERVIEIGAAAGHDVLLDLPALRAASLRVGVDLAPPANAVGWHAVAADLTLGLPFADASFDTVLCNSVLEHVGTFWLALGQMRRLLRPGGLMVLGVPAFGAMGSAPGATLIRRLARLPLLSRYFRADAMALAASSATLGFHAFPSDFYRFSAMAMRDVLLASLDIIEVRLMLQPPRAIGVARRPQP